MTKSSRHFLFVLALDVVEGRVLINLGSVDAVICLKFEEKRG